MVYVVSPCWFTCYLTNPQRLSVDDVSSTPVNISCGVPQGSVLGTRFFLLYMNDFHSFTDDSNLFSKHKSLSSLPAITN